MRQVFPSFFSILSLATFSCLFSTAAIAQITADGTTATTVNQVGDDFTIEQGDLIGDNLFHSFDEFSVPTLGSAIFNNANDVANIFSRVTGSNISNIDGVLGANRTANFYLINPNGIIFGDNAQLNLGGSFFASTADSILFDGNAEFSAINSTAPPLLEVSIPIGLSFRDNPGNIINRSFAQNSTGDFAGLEVAPGQNFTLVGGNISFETGRIKSRGGKIELGGVLETGIVGINNDGSLNFPKDVEKVDISLINAADVDVQGTGGGNIIINARNLTLEAGFFGFSRIRSGIAPNSHSSEAQAGDIKINISEHIAIDDSFISNQVDSGVGNAGNVSIITNSLSLTNGGFIDASTFGQGNGGSVDITATDTIFIDGEDFSGFPSGVTSGVDLGAVGNAGDLDIATGSLSLNNGGRIGSTTFGQGNSGFVNITATDTISIDGEDFGGLPSGISSRVDLGAVGDAGGVKVTTSSLTLTNGGTLDSITFGQGNAGFVNITATDTISIDGESLLGFSSGIFSQVDLGAVGDAGDVTITTGSLNLTNGGRIDSTTFGQGNAGDINIAATEKIYINSEISIFGSSSGVISRVDSAAIGDAGNISLTTGSLNINNGGLVDSTTFGFGNAGSVNITATDTITIDSENFFLIPSGVTSRVGLGAIGNAGDLDIFTNSLSITNGGRVDATTVGQGNAGSVQIIASDNVIIDGEGFERFPSGVLSQVVPGAEGDAGSVTITTRSLSLTNGGLVEVSTFGQGNAGSVQITASDSITIDGENSDGFATSGVKSQVTPEAEGNNGDISIITTSLFLNDGGQVNASTAGQGNAGIIEISASDSININGESSQGLLSGVIGQVIFGAEGDAEGIKITTGSLHITNGGIVSSSTRGEGSAGLVEIKATDKIVIDGESSLGFSSNISSQVNRGGVGNAGGVIINTDSLSLTDGGQVSADTNGEGNAGLVEIMATDTIIIDGEQSSGVPSGATSQVNQGAEGNSDGIIIDTASLFLTNGGAINTSISGQGNAGIVEITASDTITIDGKQSGSIPSGATSVVSPGALGNARGVTIITGSLNLTNGGLVSATTFGQGDAGDVTINARESIFISDVTVNNRSGIFANTFINDGKAGSVNVFADQLIIDDGGTVEVGSVDLLDIFPSGIGEAGDINIEANSLSLSNEARIDAVTQSDTGNNANITLQIEDDIILRDSSFISARALNNADGGNLTINTEFIIAFPNQNNDLIANANRGNGGRIEITAQSLFGIEERLSTPPNQTNDIDASTQFGLQQGSVLFNTPNLDPTSGLLELPEAVGDPSDQISQNPCEQGVGSEFTVTGKGGLPSNPNETLNSNRVRVGLVDPVLSQQEAELNLDIENPNQEKLKPAVVPAQGWIFNNQGEVMLTSYKTTDTEIRQSRQHDPLTCSSRL